MRIARALNRALITHHHFELCMTCVVRNAPLLSRLTSGARYTVPADRRLTRPHVTVGLVNNSCTYKTLSLYME
jgi:hypothetical protein